MAGRPKAIIDWKKVEKMLQAQCTAVGIASMLGIDESTLRKRCEEDNKMLFSEYIHQKKAEGKELLRSKMFASAMGGDKALMIWLSKQYLDMKEKQELEHSGTMTTITAPLSVAEAKRRMKEIEDSL